MSEDTCCYDSKFLLTGFESTTIGPTNTGPTLHFYVDRLSLKTKSFTVSTFTSLAVALTETFYDYHPSGTCRV